MSLISIKNLTFSYDTSDSNVFENVSFNIDTDWKLGFIGRNGRGKTTFLNLLTGKYEYGGKISANVNFIRFPFEVEDKSKTAYEIIQNLCPLAEEWEIMREFNLLNLSADALRNPFGNMSEGEKTKALLAGLFLSENGFPLIDEPTNHLDCAARKNVAKYLSGKKGFILVSHDRAFLDGCIDHVMSLNRANIEIQSGNFSSWFENFNRRQSFELSQNEKLKKDIARLSESARRASAWADKTEASKFGKADSGLSKDRGYVGHKAAKMMKSAKVAEERQLRAAAQKSELLKNTEKSENLKLFPLKHRSERLISIKDAEFYYGDRTVCKLGNFELNRGDRIALDGKNGCGKSTVLKIIAGENIKHSGIIRFAPDLKISYMPQSIENLNGSLSDFAREKGISETLLKAILDKTGFEKSDFDADISACSDGQKRKILIAESLCEEAHIYLWDEPLNYIDLYSRMQIERLLKEFSPTMIFVEHDAAFRSAIATKTVDL